MDVRARYAVEREVIGSISSRRINISDNRGIEVTATFIEKISGNVILPILDDFNTLPTTCSPEISEGQMSLATDGSAV